MELSDLHVFRTVVEAGGITRAAEKLNRVQSNVTTRIQQLEEQLGVALFIREGKRMHLSPAGKVMLGYAERLLELAREARESRARHQAARAASLHRRRRAPRRCGCRRRSANTAGAIRR